jgi:cytochrome c-type biogenesis protein CcmE
MSNDKRRRRVLTIVSLALALGVFAYLAFGNIGENLVYYWSPSELVSAGDDARGASVRLAGLVEPGSVVQADDGLSLQFTVTDGEQSVPVRAQTVPPAMFREGIGVVLEGSLAADGHFDTNRLMVKHDNEYRAPDTEEHRNIEELVKTLQFET